MGGFVCGRPGFCLDGGRFVPFVGGRARFVWWVVVVHGSWAIGVDDPRR
jgi:hypothetical protein